MAATTTKEKSSNKAGKPDPNLRISRRTSRSRNTAKRDRLLRFASHVTRNFDENVYLKHADGATQSKLLALAADPAFDPSRLPDDQANELEAIVVLQGRPVLFIEDDAVEQTNDQLWAKRIGAAAAEIQKNAAAVCRIEVKGHPRNDFALPGEEVYLGTGFLVGPNVVLTNRHVASEFCEANGSLKRGMSANVDFAEELARDPDQHIRIVRALEFGADYDFALLEIADSGTLPAPVSLGETIANVEDSPLVYLIGYPAFDTRNPTDAQHRLFRGIYDVKRFAPGRIRDFASRGPVLRGLNSPPVFWSDYTSLGGNSGSPVFCFSTGQCIALHFAGRYGEANYSVPISAIADRIKSAVSKTQRRGADPFFVPTNSIGVNDMNNSIITSILTDRANFMPLGAAKRIASSGLNTRSLSQVIDAAAATIVLEHFGHQTEKERICAALGKVTPHLASVCSASSANSASEAIAGYPSGRYSPGPYQPSPFTPDPYYSAIECISYPGGGMQPYPMQPWGPPSYQPQVWAYGGNEGIDARCIAGTVGGAGLGGLTGASAGPVGVGVGAISGALAGAAGSGCFDR